MQRDLSKHLQEWKTHPIRKPLILRGARQVGKTWLARGLGQSFAQFVEINFDLQTDARRIFDNVRSIDDVMLRLNAFVGQKLEPGKTLLFLDEIQECPNALKMLRYFKEELPDLHVIAAGSLLDFLLEKMGIPVGRVQYLYASPLSFYEFLDALGESPSRELINSGHVDAANHNKLLDLLKQYLVIGGMPSAVAAFVKHQDIALCQEVQDEIIQTYQDDFRKYTPDKHIEQVDKVFNAIALQLGKKFKYVNVDQDMRTEPLKAALRLLEQAGIAHKCYHSAGQSILLEAEKNPKKFKVFLFDVGLTYRMAGLDLKTWSTAALDDLHFGGITEQLVAQELIAYQNPKNKAHLYYWHREAKSSNAEVDFLTVLNGIVTPIEVKSGTGGQMKSLRVFLDSHSHSTQAIKLSEQPFGQNDNVGCVPLYGVHQLGTHKT
jgi:predicted AAA+ superfamily ATPase